jgi:hypothetical protein
MNMYRKKYIAMVVVLLGLLLFPALSVSAQETAPDPNGEVIWNEDFTLEAGERVSGDLVVFNGDVMLEDGSAVDGNVIIWNGSADVDGSIGEELVVSNGAITLGENARVDGNIVCSWSCDIDKDEDAYVGGSMIEAAPMHDLEFEYLDSIKVPTPSVPSSNFWDSAPARVLRWLFKVARGIAGVLVVALVGGIVALMWPEPTRRVGRTINQQPLASLGIGILAAVAAVVLIVGLTITICLSPVALLGGLLLGVAIFFGWISLGALLGEQLLKALKVKEITPLWAAALGTLILSAVAGGLSGFACLAPLGWLISLILGAAGLGAVAMTQFGTNDYTPNTVASRPVEPEDVGEPWEAVEPTGEPDPSEAPEPEEDI